MQSPAHTTSASADASAIIADKRNFTSTAKYFTPKKDFIFGMFTPKY
jgi:hypothetical protein